MARTPMYFGRPGSLFEIPHPRGGARLTRDRPTSVFRTAAGNARVGKTSDGVRQYTLAWEQLWYETFAQLEAFDHGHEGPGPFALIDPGRVNMLTVNQSSATSHLNDTDDFTVAGPGGVLTSTAVEFDRGPRALAWSLPVASSGLILPGASGDYASTPDAAALDIVGDYDLRADVTLDDWVSGADQNLVTKYTTTGNQRSYRMLITTTGAVSTSWSTDGTSGAAISLTSTANPVPDPDTGRLAVRVTLDVDNGAAGKTATFYTAPTIDGPWTQLGDPVTQATVTSVFASTAVLEVGSNNAGTGGVAAGVVHAAQVLSGIAGTAVANPSFEDQVPGTTSFADAAGRTWTVNGAATIGVTVAHGLTLDSPALSWPGTPVMQAVALTFSFYAKGAGTDAILALTPNLEWADVNGDVLSTSSGTPLTTNSSAFQAASVTATPPADAAYVLCKIGATGQSSGSILYLDRFQLEAASAATDWRPGTGVLPVAVISLAEEWLWEAADYRRGPALVLQEVT